MFRNCTVAGSDKAPRAIAHIGCLISVVVDRAALSFCIRSPDSFIHFLAPGLKPLTPPPAAAATLDRVVLPLPEKKPEKKSVLPAAPARADRPFRGIALILASTVFLGTSDVTSKYLSATLPSIEIAWIRFLVFALVMVPAMLPGSPLFALRTSRLGLQAMRGAALLGSSLLFISGLRFLPIAEASATSFVSPLFVTALSIFFLRESVGLRRWAATAVGLIGVLIILRPGSSAFHPAAVFPLVSAFCWALTLVMTRMLSGRERVITTMTYSAISGFLILSAVDRGAGVSLCQCIGAGAVFLYPVVVGQQPRLRRFRRGA
jgi:drug/metabolite transporter (DMT)-like permease